MVVSPPSFNKGDNFYDFLFAEKGIYSRGKEFAPKESKFFPLRVDIFLEGRQNNFDRITTPEGVSIPLK